MNSFIYLHHMQKIKNPTFFHCKYNVRILLKALFFNDKDDFCTLISLVLVLGFILLMIDCTVSNA